jgi:hypothetical protein
VASVGAALALGTVGAPLLVLAAQALDREGLLPLRPRPLVLFPPLLALAVLPWLVAAAPAARGRGGATIAALGLLALRFGLLALVPWAVRVGAAAEGLPFRPSAPAFTAIALAFPAWIVLAGVVIDAGWWLARRRAVRGAPAGPLLAVALLALAGTAAGVLLALLDRPWATTLPLTRVGRGLDVQAAVLLALPWVVAAALPASAVGAGLGAALRRVRT